MKTSIRPLQVDKQEEEPQTPVVSRKGRKRTRNPPPAVNPPSFSTEPATKKQRTEAIIKQEDVVKEDELEQQEKNPHDYFSVPSTSTLSQKFNQFIVHVNTCKRKRLGDISVESLSNHIKDLSLLDIRMIVSMLPHSFKLYYPKTILQQKKPGSGSNVLPQLCLEVVLDSYALMSVVGEFQALLKKDSIKFKWVPLPELPPAAQYVAQMLDEQNKKPIVIDSNNSAVKQKTLDKDVVATPKMDKSTPIVVEDTDDILSSETLARLAENEKKRQVKKLMDADLKRRMELARVLDVAILINTIMKVEERQRMKLPDLKKQIIDRSLNPVSRLDVSQAINLLLATQGQQWCRVESLHMHDEKVLVITEDRQTFADLKKMLESQLSNRLNLE